MQTPDKLARRRLRVVLVFRGEPQEERSFELERVRGLSRQPARITLGQQGHDSFTIPICPLPPSFPLIRAVGDEFVLRLSEGMTGKLNLSGEMMSLRQFYASNRGIALSAAQGDGAIGLREQILSPRDWGIVATDPTGAVAFFFEFLPSKAPVDLRKRPAKGPLGWLPFPVDPFVQKALAISAVVHAAVLTLAFLVWEPGNPLSIDPPPTARLARLLYQKRLEARDRERQPAGQTTNRKTAPDSDALGWNGPAALLAAQHDPLRVARRPLLSDDSEGNALVVSPKQTATPAAVDPAPSEPPPPVQALAPQPDLGQAQSIEPIKPQPNLAPAQPTPAIQATQAPLPNQPPPDFGPAQPASAAPAASPKPVAAKPAQPGPVAPLPQKPAPHGPEVLSGAPAGIGPLTRAQLDRVVTVHQDQVEECYRNELAHTANLSGKLLLVWNVDASGVVTQPHIEGSTIKNPDLESCILMHARAWRFPASRGMTLGASVPLVFRRP